MSRGDRMRLIYFNARRWLRHLIRGKRLGWPPKLIEVSRKGKKVCPKYPATAHWTHCSCSVRWEEHL